MFRLSQSNIEVGQLTANDYSTYAGFPVATFRLSGFPHGSQVGEPLTSAEKEERAKVIEDAIFSSDMGVSREMSALYGKQFSDQVSAFVKTKCEVIEIKLSPVQHFESIMANGFDCPQSFIRSTDLGLHGEDVDRKFVFPYVENVIRSSKKLSVKRAGLVFQGNEQPEQYWGLRSLMFARSIAIPKDNIHLLLMGLHEMRHLRQISIEDDPISRFYNEIDADWFAHETLKQANIGQETRRASLHARYMEMLTLNAPESVIALPLDCLLRNIAPPSYPEVVYAVKEMQVKLGAALRDGLNDESRSKLLIRTLFNEPELLYTTLKRLVDCGSITEELPKIIAQKIILAARYFDPTLLGE